MLFDDVRVFISSHHTSRGDASGSQNDKAFDVGMFISYTAQAPLVRCSQNDKAEEG
jgi:hypothetical protein